MATTFDAASSGFSNSATSLTISHTVGSGSNRLLVVQASCLNSGDNLASGTCTYNGSSMGAAIVGPASGASSNWTYTWVMVAPPTGTANVVITPSTTSSLDAVVSSYAGVDQGSPVSASSSVYSAFTASPLTRSITVSSGGMAVDFLSYRATSQSLTPDGSQTRLSTQIAGHVSTSSGSYKADATSVVWTFGGSGSAQISHVVIALEPSGGGGGGLSIPVAMNQYRQRWA